MFPSRFLMVFLIPLVILGLGVWFAVSSEVNRGSVRVAGALVGQAQVEITVKECFVAEERGFKTLTVALEARNRGESVLEIDPRLFHLVLGHVEDPIGERFPQSTYSPMRFQSFCEQVPSSPTLIPAGVVRSYTLTFWGRDLPSGEGWKDYYLSLEYYDPASSLAISKLLRPEER